MQTKPNYEKQNFKTQFIDYGPIIWIGEAILCYERMTFNKSKWLKSSCQCGMFYARISLRYRSPNLLNKHKIVKLFDQLLVQKVKKKLYFSKNSFFTKD